MQITRTTLLTCCLLALTQFLQAAPSPGYVIEWGWNTSTGTAAPTAQVLSDAVAISAGRLHCLALKSDGTVVQWGGNFRGEATFNNTVLTTGEVRSGNTLEMKSTTTIMTNGEVKIGGRTLSNIVSIAAGDNLCIALKRDGTAIGWGENSMPTGLSNVVAIAAAGSTICAVENDGTIQEWISERGARQGQLSVVPGLSNIVAVAIGENYQGTRNVALKNDSTVATWGGESIYHDATPPATLSNVVAIAVGDGHTLALKNNGTIIGWGLNNVGQATGVPTTNSPAISFGQVTIDGKVLRNVASIAAGHGYSMALKKDGTVVVWGRMANNLYPVTVPAGLSNVVAIAAGDNFCLAITTNHTVADRFRKQKRVSPK